jgi:hypothetical protein
MSLLAFEPGPTFIFAICSFRPAMTLSAVSSPTATTIGIEQMILHSKSLLHRKIKVILHTSIYIRVCFYADLDLVMLLQQRRESLELCFRRRSDFRRSLFEFYFVQNIRGIGIETTCFHRSCQSCQYRTSIGIHGFS